MNYHPNEKLFLFSVFLILFLCNDLLGQPYRNTLPPSVPGKCFAKALVSGNTTSQSMPVEKEYPLYTGPENPKIKFKSVRHYFTPPSTKWVKKRSDRKCLSQDPDDCMVWCLVEVPSDDYIDLEVLKKPRKVSEEYVEWKRYVTKAVEPSQENGVAYTEWVEVICESKIRAELMDEFAIRLIALGYEDIPLNGTASRKLKDALRAYQKEHHLPIGQFCKATFYALGLESYWE